MATAKTYWECSFNALFTIQQIVFVLALAQEFGIFGSSNMFFINGLMASAIAKETSCLTSAVTTLTSALIPYKTLMNISKTCFFSSGPNNCINN